MLRSLISSSCSLLPMLLLTLKSTKGEAIDAILAAKFPLKSLFSLAKKRIEKGFSSWRYYFAI